MNLKELVEQYSQDELDEVKEVYDTGDSSDEDDEEEEEEDIDEDDDEEEEEESEDISDVSSTSGSEPSAKKLSPSQEANRKNFSSGRLKQIEYTERVERAIIPVITNILDLLKYSYLSLLVPKKKKDILNFFITLLISSITMLIFSVIFYQAQIARFILISPYSSVLFFGVLSIVSLIGCVVSKVMMGEQQVEATEDTQSEDEDIAEDGEEDEEEVEEDSEDEESDNAGEDSEDSEEDNALSKEEYQKKLDDVIDDASGAGLLNRKYLVKVMKNILPTSTTDFADVHSYTISKDDGNIFKALHICFNTALRLTFPKKYMKPVKLDVVTETFANVVVKVYKDNNLTPTISYIDLEKNRDLISNYFVADTGSALGDDETAPMRVTDKGKFILLIFAKTSEAKPITMADVLSDKKICSFFEDENKLFPIALGLKDNNTVLDIDLFKFPHCMIMGGTGGGKSWFTAMLLVSLVAFNPPSRVSFVILDPKGSVDLMVFRKLPHTIIYNSNSQKFVEVLETVLKENERRQKLFHQYFENGADIEMYWNEQREGMPDLPEIVVVIDEMNALIAELKEDEHKKFKELVNAIISKCRSQGIKVIAIPQRPMAKIIETTSKGQITLKVAFKVDEQGSDFMFGVKNAGLSLSQKGSAGIALDVGEPPQQVRTIAVAPNNNLKNVTIEAISKFWKKNLDIKDLPDAKPFVRFVTRYDYSEHLIGKETEDETLKLKHNQVQQSDTGNYYEDQELLAKAIEGKPIKKESQEQENEVQKQEEYQEELEEEQEDELGQEDEELNEDNEEDEEYLDSQEEQSSNDTDSNSSEGFIEADTSSSDKNTENSDNAEQEIPDNIEIADTDVISSTDDNEDGDQEDEEGIGFDEEPESASDGKDTINKVYEANKDTEIVKDDEGYVESDTDFNEVNSIKYTNTDSIIESDDFKSVKDIPDSDKNLRKYYHIRIYPDITNETAYDKLMNGESSKSNQTEESVKSGLLSDSIDVNDYPDIVPLKRARLRKSGNTLVPMTVYEYVKKHGSVTLEDLQENFEEDEIDSSIEGGEIVRKPSDGTFVTFF